jgi:hypothetical protein
MEPTQQASAPAGMFFCDVCLVKCAGSRNYDLHLKGKKHKHQQHLAARAQRQHAAAAAAAHSTAGAGDDAGSAGNDSDPAPTEAQLAAAEQVMLYFGRHLAELEQSACRSLRKAMAPVVEHFVCRKWYGGAAPDLSLAKAQVRLLSYLCACIIP